MPDIVIIANCHSMSLARALSLSARDLTVSFIDINFLGRDNENEVTSKIYGSGSENLRVFSFPLGEQFPLISSKELLGLLGERFKTFTNIRFDGLHPDMTYIGSRTNRLHGVLGAYHSKILAYAFVKGMSIRDCVRMFDRTVYEKLGYFGQFELAKQNLYSRDKFCDLKFAGRFISILKERPSLYTFNHPAGHVFQALARDISEFSEYKFVDFDPSCGLNELSNNYIWPIYNEIAEFHGLPYRTPQYFVDSQSFSSRALSLEEMVKGSYRFYSGLNPDDLLERVSQEQFFQEFNAIIG